MEAQEVKSEKITLCDLIRGFMEFAADCGKISFPSLFIGTRPWHEFLYTLKWNHKFRFPDLKCIGEFDWNGPYPTARNWNNVASAITTADICGPRTYTNRIYFYPDRKRKENPIVISHPLLLPIMFGVACETKGFFED